MPQTHGIGKFFWHKIRLAGNAPRHHRYCTREYEFPYRASISHIFRLAGRVGIAIGWWHGGGLAEESPEYERHLNSAVQGRALTPHEEFRLRAEDITVRFL